jgi:hypothetical protein
LSKKLHLTFEEIFKKLEDREFMLVHMKETMEPKILHVDTLTTFDVPYGYMEYDSKIYFRKV